VEETIEHESVIEEKPETEETKAPAAANAKPDEGEADETPDGQEPDSPPEDEEERKSRSQRQRERRKAYIAELETKAKDAQDRLSRLKQAHEGRAEPKEADYDDLTEYAVARALWRQSQTETTSQQKAIEAEVGEVEKQRQREVAAAFRERVSEAKGRYEDFEAVAFGDHVKITPDMASLIQSSDAGPDLAYHLGSNPHVAARIATLPPAQQAYELGRIDSRLTAPKPRTQSAAPQPIKPVGGRASGEKDPSKMSIDEYKAWRAKGGGA
jgi:hypothetical protein